MPLKNQKKIVCGRFSHESHSFSLISTSLIDFAKQELFFGDAITARMADTKTEMGGFLAAAKTFGWNLVPVMSASTSTSGPVTVAAFEAIVEPLLMELKAQRHIDGVLLSLHGAMYVEEFPDPEGELLRRIREIVGPNMPIAATLDLHANVTDQMIANVDILTSYRTTPHIDQYETAMRAAALLDRTLKGEIRPKVYIARRDTLHGMDLGRTVGDTPMTRMQAKARDIEKSMPGLADISLNAGYYLGDVYEAGPSVIAVGTDASGIAQKTCETLMDEVLTWRDEKTVHLISIEQAIAHASRPASGSGPLILADYTDGPGGGGYGDATSLMAAIVEAQIPNSVVGPLFDPESAQQAAEAGVGVTLKFAVGGKTDARFGGAPLHVEAKVIAISDGVYVRAGAFRTGTKGNLGTSAALEVGSVRIIVSSNRMQAEERNQYRIFGIEPQDVNVIALKGINHFRADFEPVARAIFYVEAGGMHATDLRSLPYKNVRRPVYPLDA